MDGEVCCDKHNARCMLKTGMKEGPSYLKTFFICSQIGPDMCNFAQEARGVEPMRCLVHKDQYVDLQNPRFSQSANEQRIHFRCTIGKQERKAWCGYVAVKPSTGVALTKNDASSKPKVTELEKENCTSNGDIVMESASTNQKSEKAQDITLKESAATNQESEKPRNAASSDPQQGGGLSSTAGKESRKPASAAVSSSSSRTASSIEPHRISARTKLDPNNKSDPNQKPDQNNKPDPNKNPDSNKKPDPNKGHTPGFVTDSSHEWSVCETVRSAEVLPDPIPVVAYQGMAGAKPKAGLRVSQLVCQDRDQERSNVSMLNNSTAYRDKSLMVVSDDDDDDSDKSDEEESSNSRTLFHEMSSRVIKANQSSTERTVGITEQRMEEKTMKNTNKETMRDVKASDYSAIPAAMPSKTVGSTEPRMGSQKGLAVSDVLAPRADVNLPAALAKRDQTRKDLQTQTILLSSLSLSALPDGGARIRNRIALLTEDLKQLGLQINSYASTQCSTPVATAINPTNHNPGAVRPVSSCSGLNTVAASSPWPASRQTKLTDYRVPSWQEQALAMTRVNAPQQHVLYGGRMTTARLQEVGSVTSEAIEQLHEQLESCPSPDKEAEDPEGLRVPLMLHQRQAIAWMCWREAQHPAGGILADDMGLGKTLTMIALILARHESAELATDPSTSFAPGWLSKECKDVIKSKATLVICPASLVHQWHKEIAKRVERGKLSVILYHGADRDCSAQHLAAADVVLTTYNLVSREVGVPEDHKKDKHAHDLPATDGALDTAGSDSAAHRNEAAALLRIEWRRIIIDEAHQIKNHKSLTAMSVCRLRAAHRWALTGTPIHNDLLDMYALLRFLRCSPFDEYKVWKKQVDNKSAKGTQRLNVLVKGLLLRRTKDQNCLTTGKQLVPLPNKTSRMHKLTLSAEERRVYDRIYNQSKAAMQEYLRRHDERLWSKETTGGGSKPSMMGGANVHQLGGALNPWSKDDERTLLGARGPLQGGAQAGAVQVGGAEKAGNRGAVGGGHILLLLLRLRQCCGHLHLMKDALDVEALQSDGLDLNLVEQMNELALQENEPLQGLEGEREATSAFDISVPSTKIKTLLEILDVVRTQSDRRSPSKSVVVSQWTKMLDVIEHHLVNAGYRCCTIRGSVPPKTRSELVEAFNTDPRGPEVMLVSLKAGGVGLNLIGGNHLFMIDMHWNPALELQACDRIYRVGQKKEVFIHRFMCENTVEEKIIQLQKQKTALAANVLSGSAVADSKLSLADLRLLFGIGPDRLPGSSGFDTASQASQSSALRK